MLPFLLFFFVSFFCEGIDPPLAGKRYYEELAFEDFGYSLIDYYYYFREDENSDYMDQLISEENEYSNSNIDQILIEQLEEEIDSYVPFEEHIEIGNHIVGDYEYYEVWEHGKEFPKWARMSTEDTSNHHEFFDENDFVNFVLGDPEYFSLIAIIPSPDGKYVAFAYDIAGMERYTIRFVNVETGELLEDELFDGFYDYYWSTDSIHFMYLLQEEFYVQPTKVMVHTIGQSQEDDVIIYDESDPRYEPTLERTSSGAYIMLLSSSLDNNEIYLIDADFDEQTVPELFFEKEPHVNYDIDHSGEYFYMFSQFDGAVNFKIERFNEYDLDSEREMIQEASADYLIRDIRCMKDYLVVQQWETNYGIPELVIIHLDTLESQMVPIEEDIMGELMFSFFDLSGHGLIVSEDQYFYKDFVDIEISSFTTSWQTWRYHIEDDEFELIIGSSIPDYHPEDYVEGRVFVDYVDEDGNEVSVPASFVYKQQERYEEKEGEERIRELWNEEEDGPRPMLMESYCAYGDIYEPYYDYSIQPYLDRGFIFVIPHLRGGTFRGTEWYTSGKLLQKQHTFEDLVAVADYFIETKTTSSDRLGIKGRSAGGLTVTGAMERAPELFNLVVADVPFVDVIMTMMDPMLSFAMEETFEWGNVYNEEDFLYMLEYDPYWNIEEDVDYPTVYLEGDRNDKRVNFWMPIKFTQKLRDYQYDDEENNLVLLNVYGGGHFGGTGEEEMKEWAREHAFVIQTLLEDPSDWYGGEEVRRERNNNGKSVYSGDNDEDHDELTTSGITSLLWIAGTLSVSGLITCLVLGFLICSFQLCCVKESTIRTKLGKFSTMFSSKSEEFPRMTLQVGEYRPLTEN